MYIHVPLLPYTTTAAVAAAGAAVAAVAAAGATVAAVAATGGGSVARCP